MYARLTEIPGLSSTVSDVLDDLGYQLVVPTTEIAPLNRGIRVIGPAVTLRYLPQRQISIGGVARLAHMSAFERAERGDVLVIEADDIARYSVFGGLAALTAQKRGLAACLVDGAVRDIDEISQSGLEVWSRGTTCITGRGRLEGFSLNLPIGFAGVQVRPGDTVVADDSGICFIPPEALEEVCRQVVAIHDEELNITQQ